MLLRASGETTGKTFSVKAVTDGSHESGVPHGAALVRLAEATLGDAAAVLGASREEVRKALGPDGLVDAAAVIATFSKMDRIADATGIPLDGPMGLLTQGLREEIGINHFASASNTPESGALARAAARVLGPLAFRVLRRVRAPGRRESP
ncbi:MAG: hypothetical protein JRH16_22305 [Deltaproteobacteria bacterium]|nr:hypothetical protein [Deltaproteobacteria bacterium]MBW2416051.1 hypothetical protein [Deltaproteobacteria bacterium]